MAVLSNVFDQVCADINITRERYTELITAEHELLCIKDVLCKKANSYSGITSSEVELLKTLFVGDSYTDEDAD